MGIAPSTPEGYVYYVRLNTAQGSFYKIGFTKRETVEERFSYGGSENYKLIDEVLFYKYSMHAYEIEQILHEHLGNRRAFNKYGFAALFRDMSQQPLFGDGQTELYRDDVLGLDPNPKRRFDFFRLFSKPKSDLVRRRMLAMDHYHHSVKEYQEKLVYRLLDEFLAPPFFESKKEFVSRSGEWVVSLQRWATRNALGSSPRSDGKTVHGCDVLPNTMEQLLQMTKFCPVWAYTDSIPDEIRHLKKLTVIKFPFASIQRIPDGLYELENLKELDISYSAVPAISGRIGKFKNLEILNIACCPNITSLPPEIESLERLRKIIISKSNFDIFRRCIPNKSHLLVWNEGEM